TGPSTGGTAVAITGTNFVNGATVAFGANAGTGVSVVNSTTITATSPATITLGIADVRVTTSGGTSPNAAADDFTYTAVTPTVTSINPTSGPTGGGTSVVITGTGFVTGATVRFGSTSAAGAVVNSPTQITVPSPATVTPGAVDVTVTNTAGTSATSASDLFTYQAVQPAITSLNPTSGQTGGGTTVTITGTNFITGATVDFGGVAATGVVV